MEGKRRLARLAFISGLRISEIRKFASSSVVEPRNGITHFTRRRAVCLDHQSGRRGFNSSITLYAREKIGPSGTIDKYAKKDRQKLRQAPVERPYVPITKPTVVTPGKVVEIFEGMTVELLAERLGQPVAAVEGVLSGLGEACESSTQPVNIDAAELVALECGASVSRVVVKEKQAEKAVLLPLRPPVITVMGHVDHGKTSLLDALRKTAVAAGEAGGITQHLGAFVVKMTSGASLTFLDTPGHAAFSSMRARGAAVTDIVVLVVAADDGVKPQTLEALRHAQDAKVPIVVAINKCDKPDANPSKVRQQLIAHNVELEDIGGEVQLVEISAKTGTGLDKLEEALTLTAEMMELRAPVDGDARAIVIEAKLDRGQGPVATVVVRSGTLIAGSCVVVGHQWGRIRNLRDMSGVTIKSAGPAIPVEINGLRGVPLAGDELHVVANEDRARRLAQLRQSKLEEDRLRKLTLKSSTAAAAAAAAAVADSSAAAADGDTDAEQQQQNKASEVVELALVVKADVQGTAEAVTQALESLNSSQVSISIVHTGIGPVAESDVDLAEACNGCIVAFNVRSLPAVQSKARRSGVPLVHHRVIYHLLEDVGKVVIERAPGTPEIRVSGQAEVLAIYEIKGKGRAGVGAAKVAGCRVFEGKLHKEDKVKVLRSGDIIFEGNLTSLKHGKSDVDTIAKGSECGAVVGGWMDFSVGDVIQAIEDYRRKPKVVSSDGTVRIEC